MRFILAYVVVKNGLFTMALSGVVVAVRNIKPKMSALVDSIKNSRNRWANREDYVN